MPGISDQRLSISERKGDGSRCRELSDQPLRTNERDNSLMIYCRKLFALSALGLALIFGGRAQAAGLVYDNGPINGTLNAWNLSPGTGFSVSDSFTVSANTTLQSAQAGLWVGSGDFLTSTDWAVGTTPFGTDISSGTGAALSNTFQFTNGIGFDIYESTFALSGAVSVGTTYYFTLLNVAAANGSAAGWDINNGPSTAFQNTIGNANGFFFPGTNSDPFQLFGASSVPEPSSLVLAVMGAVGGLGVFYRRRCRVAKAG